MSWLGIGLSSRNSDVAVPAGLFEPPLASLTPAALWTGQPGSGFASLPVDPVRTTAKPALRLLTPPYQRFTHAVDVGVIAMANDGGSMVNTLGVAEVTFHFEGSSTVVTEPRWHTILTQRGLRSYFGWWVRLRRPPQMTGNGHLYVEARPRDATMQSRVIGPFMFSPVASLYDASFTVDPDAPEVADQNYRSLGAALTRVRTRGLVNPLITIVKPGTYSNDITSSGQWGRAGYCNITASVPGVTLGFPQAPTFTSLQTIFPVQSLKLHIFGPHITIDYANFATFDGDLSNQGFEHWLDGITITNSLGRNTFFRGDVRADLRRVRGRAYFTECEMSRLDNLANNASLVRGCNVSESFTDCVNAATVVQSRFDDHSQRFFNDNEPMFSVHYTGPETVATIARRGGLKGEANTDGVGMYRVVIGSSTYDFVVGNSSASYWNRSLGDGFWFADVVAWLNTLPGITATLLTSVDRSAGTGCLGPELTSETPLGTLGRGWGFPGNSTPTPVDIKAEPRIIRSFFDLHADWFQHGTGTVQNCILFGNVVTNCTGQAVFLGPVNSGIVQRDVFFVGNAFHRPVTFGGGDGEGNASQWWIRHAGASISHVVIAHNSWAGQRMMLRSSFPAVSVGTYSMFANNAAPDVSVSVESFGIATIRNNHIRASALIPATGTGWTQAGQSSYDFYANAAAGDFTPLTPLLQNMSAPSIAFDSKQSVWAGTGPAGAFAQ